MALQMPTVANPNNSGSPYYQWSEANWDFRTNTEYPTVEYGRGDDAANPACGTSQQPRCRSILIRTKVFLEGPLR